MRSDMNCLGKVIVHKGMVIAVLFLFLAPVAMGVIFGYENRVKISESGGEVQRGANRAKNSEKFGRRNKWKEADFPGGNGSIDNPYRIANIFQLQNMSQDLDANYVLINDIDASATTNWNWNGSEYNGFDPIAKDTDPAEDFQGTKFTGNFDGRGYNITNLYINRTSEDYVGLFGYVDTGANIRNVSLVGYDISGSWYVGGLIGYNWKDSIVEYGKGLGKIRGGAYVGGLIGYNRGTIKNCSTIITVSGSLDYIGGLAGHNDPKGYIENSYATGSVNGRYSVGGLVGNNKGTVTKSFARGNVTGKSDTGGLVGTSSYGNWIRSS